MKYVSENFVFNIEVRQVSSGSQKIRQRGKVTQNMKSKGRKSRNIEDLPVNDGSTEDQR